MNNKSLKKRVIEIAFIIVISCILFLSCNHDSENRKLQISKAGDLNSSELKQSGLETSERDGEDETSDCESANEQTELYVYVCGAVVNPGLYALPEGARAMDAVTAAGGFTEDAARDIINLAEPETDGSMLRIPTKQEAADGRYETSVGMTGTRGISVNDTRIDINSADAAKLSEIPGIGETKAKAITDYRERNGKFSKEEDLMNVPGIKAGTFEKMKDYIKVNP